MAGDELLRLRRARHGAIGGCVGAAGHERIDPDALRTELAGQGQGEADEAGLAGRVGGRAREPGAVPDERGREDDRAASAPEHGRHLILRAEKGAGQVGLERVMPACQRQVVGRSHLAEHAGVVERDVETAEPIHRGVDQGSREVRLPDVAGHRDGPARGADLRHQLIEAVAAARGQDQPRPLAREQLRSRVADSGAGTRDDRDLSVQRSHFIPPCRERA
jgi:hypothetical protein